MNFFPLISGAPSPERAKRMLAVMTDPTQFWGEWNLPTVSRADPLFPQQGYWHGSIWGPVNYLVFQGVAKCAEPATQAEYAAKSVKLFMKNWTATGVCGENYSSITGEQRAKGLRSSAHYSWGALLCLIGLESMVHLHDDGTATPGAGLGQDMELKNMPWNGKIHSITSQQGKIVISEMR
jgi:glycogen debranching enzyme